MEEESWSTQEARDILETECVFSYAPAHKSDAGDHFRMDGSDVTITVHPACAQEFAVGGATDQYLIQKIHCQKTYSRDCLSTPLDKLTRLHAVSGGLNPRFVNTSR